MSSEMKVWIVVLMVDFLLLLLGFESVLILYYISRLIGHARYEKRVKDRINAYMYAHDLADVGHSTEVKMIQDQDQLYKFGPDHKLVFRGFDE